MTGKTKSILLQVAFKGAIEAGVPNEEQIISFYEMLLALHDRFDIDPDDTGKRTTSGTGRANSAARAQGEVFTFNNILVEDFRQAKATQGLKANYPDFKTVNGDVIEGITNAQGAAWLYEKESGSPNEAVQQLVAAADAKVF